MPSHSLAVHALKLFSTTAPLQQETRIIFGHSGSRQAAGSADCSAKECSARCGAPEAFGRTQPLARRKVNSWSATPLV